MPKKIDQNRVCNHGHSGQWKRQQNGKVITVRCNQCSKDRARTKIYGLTPEAYAQMKVTDPVCAMCGEDGSAVGLGSLEIDHNHTTLEIRGLLCRTCNLFLGWYENNKHLIPSAEAYLAR